MSIEQLMLSLFNEPLSLDSGFNGNDFGLGLHPHHIHRHAPRHRLHELAPSHRGNRWPERWMARRADTLAELANQQRAKSAVAAVGKDGFQVCMDVAQFKPNELNVKVQGNTVVVEGKHEERADDHGFISRHFVRRYKLPDGYKDEAVVSTLSSDGILTISAPKPPAIEDKADNGRTVQIQQVGPAHLNVKHNEAVENSGDSNGDSAAK